MRKSQEHVVDNPAGAGALVVAGHTGSVAVVWSSTQGRSGSDILGGVAAVMVGRMFQRNVGIRVASPAWKAVLVYT